MSRRRIYVYVRYMEIFKMTTAVLELVVNKATCLIQNEQPPTWNVLMADERG